MADELSRIDAWLVATLLASSSVTAIAGQRVHGELAPADSTWPCVVFQHQASADVAGAAADRIMVDALYVVKGIHRAETFTGTVKALADAIDTALHRTAGAAGSDGFVLSCTRERPFRLVETDDGGAQYRHAGGVYRILAQVP